MWIMWTLLSAGASDKEPVFWTGEHPRALKIDLFSFSPRMHPWGRDWRLPLLGQWTAALHCVRERSPYTERCRFQDSEILWSVILEESGERTTIALPAPGVLELRWAPNGRSRGWQLRGDREAFYAAASDAMIEASFRGPDDEAPEADDRRRIGQHLESSMLRQLVGALEWELPRGGGAQVSWNPRQAPWAGRRHTQSTSDPHLQIDATYGDAPRVHLELYGQLRESRAAGFAVAGVDVETQVIGRAVFDRSAGHITSSRHDTFTSSRSGPLVGYIRTLLVVEQLEEGAEVLPATLLEPAIR